MNKRLAAGFLASASTAAVLGVTGAPPAAAASPCGTYPPGQHYVMTRVPASAHVARGTLVRTRGTLRRGGQACVGYPLGFYVKVASSPTYRLRAHGPSDATGSFRASQRATTTFRFFYNVRLSSSAFVRSTASEIIAR